MGPEAALANQRLRTPRAAAIAGIVFSTLTISYQITIWMYIPANPLESASELVSHAKALSFAIKCVPFAGIAFLWFIGVVRDRLGTLEDRFFATTFFGSGLLYVAMLFTSGALAAGLLQAIERGADTLIRSDAYTIARTEIYQITTTYATKMAGAFMITTSTISKRTQIIPPKLVAVGFISAIFLLLSAGSMKWSPMIFPIWVLLISIWILMEGISSAPREGQEQLSKPR